MSMNHCISLRGVLRFQEPLARYTTWRVGGPARRFYRPADLADLGVYLARQSPDEPLLWLGLGSNLLVRDGGFAGSVILMQGALQDIRRSGEYSVRVEAGVACAKVARFCARHGLTGVEFLAGIPGTMGGALAMNAGAWGGETWRWVSAVETMDRNGQTRYRSPDDFTIAYRSVVGLRQEGFTVAYLSLQPGCPDRSSALIRDFLQQRNRSQPTRVASCGSVFRNPPDDYAARLIDTAGLKGHRIGGAQVSEQHANFIVNAGTATAADLEALIGYVATRVEACHGVRLRPEVRIVGDPGQCHQNLPESTITAREVG